MEPGLADADLLGGSAGMPPGREKQARLLWRRQYHSLHRSLANAFTLPESSRHAVGNALLTEVSCPAAPRGSFKTRRPSRRNESFHWRVAGVEKYRMLYDDRDLGALHQQAKTGTAQGGYRWGMCRHLVAPLQYTFSLLPPGVLHR